jgi:hypothetical protein
MGRRLGAPRAASPEVEEVVIEEGGGGRFPLVESVGELADRPESDGFVPADHGPIAEVTVIATTSTESRIPHVLREWPVRVVIPTKPLEGGPSILRFEVELFGVALSTPAWGK